MVKVEKYKVKAEFLSRLLAGNSGKEKGVFVFARDKQGNVVLEPYRLQSFFEDAAKALFYDKPKIIERVQHNLFVKDVKLSAKEPADFFSRPVVIKVPNDPQPKTSLIKSEYLEEGTKMEFIVEVIPGKTIDLETIKTLLSYGERRGIGAWRKAGFGRFKVESIEPLHKVLK